MRDDFEHGAIGCKCDRVTWLLGQIEITRADCFSLISLFHLSTKVDPADLPTTDSTAETATPLESPPESPPPPSTPKDVDEILSSRDAEIEDFDNGGYQPVVMQGPEKHNEL